MSSSTGEIEPAWTVGGGQAEAAAGQPWFGLLASGTAPTSDQSVVVVNPSQFLGDAKSQDSVFVGLAKDAQNYVMAWYNNVSTHPASTWSRTGCSSRRDSSRTAAPTSP